MLRRHIWFGSTRPLLTNVNNLSPGSTLTTIYIYIYIYCILVMESMGSLWINTKEYAAWWTF